METTTTRNGQNDRRLLIGLLAALVALSAQGILNFVFRGTPLNVWKQLLMLALLFVAPLLLKANKPRITTWIALSSPLLIASSLANGENPQFALQNLLYYISWYPFFLLGLNSDRSFMQEIALPTSLTFIVISGLGFIIQLYTPYLNFLKDNVLAISLQLQFHEAQRLYLYFVSSTLALPCLIGFFYIVCRYARHNWQIALGMPFLAMSAIPTGSLSANITAGLGILMGLASLRAHIGARLGYAASLAFAAIVVILPLRANLDPLAAAQYERVFNNNQYSDSNRTRFTLWEGALNTISEFNFIEHAAGLGIGATVSERWASSRASNGESSFFQAYIEGGITGFLLRIAPFFIIGIAVARRPSLSLGIYCFAVTFACAMAPIFGPFGVQCTIGMVAGLATRKEATK